MVKLPGYEGEIGQVAVTGLGREQPTLFLTNQSHLTRNAGEDPVSRVVHKASLSKRQPLIRDRVALPTDIQADFIALSLAHAVGAELAAVRTIELARFDPVRGPVQDDAGVGLRERQCEDLSFAHNVVAHNQASVMI
jgi:hypothetical protein